MIRFKAELSRFKVGDPRLVPTLNLEPSKLELFLVLSLVAGSSALAQGPRADGYYRLADIDRVAFRGSQRRPVHRDSLLRIRDSIARANGLRRRQ